MPVWWAPAGALLGEAAQSSSVVDTMGRGATVLAGSYQSPFADTCPNPLRGDLLGLRVLVPAT